MKLKVRIFADGKAKVRAIDLSDISILTISAEWIKEKKVKKIIMEVV